MSGSKRILFLSGGTPTIVLSADSIFESASIGATVGVLSVRNGQGTWSFSETSDPDNKFTVSGSLLNTSATLDYETSPAHSVTIQATNGTDTINRTFVIAVTDVPIITNGATGTVAENATLSFALTDNTGAATWSIVGGADSAQFEISGSTLRWAANGTQNYEAPADANTDNAYVVNVRATVGADTADKTITITVTDVTEVIVGPSGSGILLEAGDYLLAEDSSFLILE